VQSVIEGPYWWWRFGSHGGQDKGCAVLVVELKDGEEERKTAKRELSPMRQ